jgi:HD-like signal output (HDOD) protein
MSGKSADMLHDNGWNTRTMEQAAAFQGIDPALFRQFKPFDNLTEDELLLLATKAEIRSEKRRYTFFEHGTNDPWTICLLEGLVELKAVDGGIKTIEAGTPASRRPLAQLKPRQFTATALSPVTFLRIDNSSLGDFMNGIIANHYEVEELDDGYGMELTSEVQMLQQHDLAHDSLSLPSLPDVALKVSRLLSHDDVDVARIGKAVNADPAIAAKLIRAANSPLYHGQSQVDSCERAIVRLGTGTARQLVMSFAMRELFETKSPLLAKRMEKLWQHSTEVAAICFVLARKSGKLEPEQGLLAGLLHDIGIVSLITHVERNPTIAETAEKLETFLRHNRAKTSAMILRHWNFPEQLVLAAGQAENWLRAEGKNADYADLVIAAQLHSLIGTPEMPDIPPMDQLTAFKKLMGKEIDPAGSLAILKEAKQEIHQIRSLLGS